MSCVWLSASTFQVFSASIVDPHQKRMDVHGPPDPCLRKRVLRVEGHDVSLRRGLENKHGADHGLPVVGEQRARNDGGYAARGKIALMRLVVCQAKRQGARLVQA